jgi:hypothetical protein
MTNALSNLLFFYNQQHILTLGEKGENYLSANGQRLQLKKPADRVRSSIMAAGKRKQT